MARRRARRRPARSRRREAPPLAVVVLLAVASLAAVNFAYQVIRKPTELLGLVAPTSPKPPEATWAEYGALFEEHSTDLVRPELLAALVQVESAGDPLARTYWRWRWSWNPLELYAPASSAVGILQITDGTFVEASRLCIHDHAVAHEGAWYDPRACWLNALYFRTVPSHAIEMTAALLHEAIAEALGGRSATVAQGARLAALVHLCGRGRAPAFAARGFRALPGERCGDTDLGGYLDRVEALSRTFARMAAVDL
ncbi:MULTISPECIES: transglycosylase SLT domain-containing protein [Anaeromyxobacter]|uniref:transglycosylase SLT domain-containing protein n=1 Tax=Anaeromyxobacter TaxID=161492 RepID=UPI001F599FEE|nr:MULTISPECIES: transglycosylase SLT domain-containing protein [unclassified Anaeromyxobacter]